MADKARLKAIARAEVARNPALAAIYKDILSADSDDDSAKSRTPAELTRSAPSQPAVQMAHGSQPQRLPLETRPAQHRCQQPPQQPSRQLPQQPPQQPAQLPPQQPPQQPVRPPPPAPQHQHPTMEPLGCSQQRRQGQATCREPSPSAVAVPSLASLLADLDAVSPCLEMDSLQVDDMVVVLEDFWSDSEGGVMLRKGQKGCIEQMDGDGDAYIRFRDHSQKQWVYSQNFRKIAKIPAGLPSLEDMLQSIDADEQQEGVVQDSRKLFFDLGSLSQTTLALPPQPLTREALEAKTETMMQAGKFSLATMAALGQAILAQAHAAEEPS